MKPSTQSDYPTKLKCIAVDDEPFALEMIADDIQFVTEQELDSYESTGAKMKRPTISKKVTATRVSGSKTIGEVNAAVSNPVSDVPTKPRPLQEPVAIKKLYVQVKDPDDHGALLALKQVCSQFSGTTDIVLVLGAEKKSAIKLPFKVNANDELVGALVKILGEDAVILK